MFGSKKEQYNAATAVPVVKLVGGISTGKKDLNLETVTPLLSKAFNIAAKSKHKTVVLDIDCPGGCPVTSQQLGDAIQHLSKENGVAVLSYANRVAASGGYWLACAGKEIYANEMAAVGSIGVVSQVPNFSGLAQKLGVEMKTITQGANKARLSPFEPIKEDDVKWIKARQAGIHKHFIDYVTSRRGNKLKADNPDLFSGEIWMGKEAIANGLIDGTSVSVDSYLRKNFGNDYNKVVVTPKPKTLLGMLFNRVAVETVTADSIVDATAAKIGQVSLWGRFGLTPPGE